MLFGQSVELVERYVEGSRNLQLSVAVRKNGESAFLSYNRDSLLATPHPLVFEIGSITKTFVGSMLTKALSEGKICLGDSVGDYFAGLPSGYYYPTILQLATHTAGYGETLPYSPDQKERFGKTLGADPLRANPFRDLTERDIEIFVGQAKLTENTYPPVYSNLGIAILGLILAKIEGHSIVETLARFITHDMDLEGFYLDRPRNGYVEGFDSIGNNCGNWLWGGGPFTCVGGLYSTAESLLNYGDAQMSGRLPYLKLGHRPYADCFEPGAKTGLCWLIWPEDEIIWHNGGTGCFKTFFGFIQSKNAAVAILSNQKQRNGVTPEQIGTTLLKTI